MISIDSLDTQIAISIVLTVLIFAILACFISWE